MTGDNVSALAFCDVDDDHKQEMLVGTEDYEIRVLRQESPRSPHGRRVLAAPSQAFSLNA